MQTAGIAILKKELEQCPPQTLRALCLQLAKYKVENKELLHYLLFEAGDEESYIRQVREETEEAFREMNKGNLHWVKKSLRKALRQVNKYIKFSGDKQTETVILLHFCTQMRDSGIPFQKSQVLLNLYLRQIARIEKSIFRLHEDLQYDYRPELERLKTL